MKRQTKDRYRDTISMLWLAVVALICVIGLMVFFLFSSSHHTQNPINIRVNQSQSQSETRISTLATFRLM